MKTSHRIILTTLAVTALGLLATFAEAIDPSWGKAAENKIYAQKLVNAQLAKNPDVKVIGLHVTKPGEKSGRLLAINMDRIGKEDDADDAASAIEHKTVIAPKPEMGQFEVLMPLKDAAGNFIGATGIVFGFKAGDDEVKLYLKAVAINNELAKSIPNYDALLKPARL